MVFDWLLRTWLQNAAQDKIREKVVQAAREQMAPEATENDWAQRPCDVGLVFALGIESGGLEDLLEGSITVKGHQFVIRQGGLKRRHVALAVSGVGPAAAARAAEALLTGHRPQWLISAGFSGACSRAWSAMRSSSARAWATPRAAVSTSICKAVLWPGGKCPARGSSKLISVDRILRRPEEKRALGQEHGALAVDMESSRWRKSVAARRPVFWRCGWSATRSMKSCRPTSSGWCGKRARPAAGAPPWRRRWTGPGRSRKCSSSGRTALVASDRLAKFLASLVVQLAPLGKAEGEKERKGEGETC